MINPIYDYRNKNSKKSDKFIKELTALINKNESANKIEFNFNGYKYTLEKESDDLMFKISDDKETVVLPGEYFKTFANQFDETFRSLVKERVQDYIKQCNEELQDYEILDKNIKVVDKAVELQREELSQEEIEQNNINKIQEELNKNLSLNDIQKILENNIDKNSQLIKTNDSVIYKNTNGSLELNLINDKYEITKVNNLSAELCTFINDVLNDNINCLNHIDKKIEEYTSENLDEEIIDADINISR